MKAAFAALALFFVTQASFAAVNTDDPNYNGRAKAESAARGDCVNRVGGTTSAPKRIQPNGEPAESNVRQAKALGTRSTT